MNKLIAPWSGMVLLGLFVLLCTSGCARKSPPVSYYSLTSIDKQGAEMQPVADLDISVGVGPVTTPDYLKRVHIATRAGDTRYEFNEFQRWAGLIEKDIATVIGNNLGVFLQTERIAFFPWMHYFKPDYRVVIEMIQFDSALDGDAVLRTRWAISDSSGDNMLAVGKDEYRQPLERADYASLVKAQSKVLADFSRDIALQIKGLAQ